MNLFDQIKNEKWVKIPNYDNYYINNKGQVIRVYINTITKLEHCKKSVSLNKNGKIESRWIMTLMRKLFPKEEWDKSLRGFVEDLEWVTHQENMNHAVLNDRMFKVYNSEKKTHENSKLDEEKVRLIRKLYYEDKLGQITIAKMLNVSKNAISGVVTWRTWFYVDPDKKEYYKSIKATKHKNGEE